MYGLRNGLRCAAYPCCWLKTYISPANSNRKVHTNIMYLLAKKYMDKENHFAFQTIKDKGFSEAIKMISKISVSQEEFQEMLKEKWCKCSSKVLFENLSKFGSYCSKHNLCLSNQIFDDYVDCLTNNIKHASDYELEYLFYSLKKFPPTETAKTKNFFKIWAALDDECLNRIQNWSVDEKLKFVTLFYMLNISRMSRFSVKCMQKLASKGKQLSSSQLVQVLFFVGVHRKAPDDMHNLEIRLGNIFDQFTIDDLAAMSMGFFKSKTPIRDINIVIKIIDKVIEEACHIHEISLSALLKVIRYSRNNLINYYSIYQLLESLRHEVSRLCVMCNVHIAQLGASTLILHKECITAVANKILSNITEARMKDLERMALTLGILNYIPKTKECFIEKIISELRKPSRQQEIELQGRSFVRCVAYLTLLGYYPEDLMAKILNKNFLHKTYGEQVSTYERVVFSLHNSAAIFSKKFVPLLSDKETIILAKKWTDFLPEEANTKQFFAAEKMLLDVMRLLKDDRGGDQFVVATHLLTHHQRRDLILCNSRDGKPLPVIDTFNISNFGIIHKAPKDDNFWIPLVIGTTKSIVSKLNTPTGPIATKIRELKELGFYPALILWFDYRNLQTEEEKIKFLNSAINKALCDR